MGKQHEILAVEGDLSSVASKVIEEAGTLFSKKNDHFFGQIRKVSMFDSSREGENTTDSKEMVTSVPEKLAYLSKRVSPFYDVVLQKEATNQKGSADLIVNGKKIAENLPATFLLGMETKLTRLRRVYEVIPTLQPGIKWEPTPDQGVGRYVQANPQVSMRTEKNLDFKVIVPATDRHPAQVEKWTEDKPVGRIETVVTSGMLSPADKATLLNNLDQLIRAVKKARQRANDIEVEHREIGEALFKHIHSGVEIPS